MKIGNAYEKNASFERRPSVRCSRPLRSCRTIRRSNVSYFPPGYRKALRTADLKTVGEVREMSDETLISLPDFGKGSLAALRAKLGLPSTDGVGPVSKSDRQLSRDREEDNTDPRHNRSSALPLGNALSTSNRSAPYCLPPSLQIQFARPTFQIVRQLARSLGGFRVRYLISQ